MKIDEILKKGKEQNEIKVAKKITINKSNFKKYSKKQLIYLLEKCKHSLFMISEICVDESKSDISSKNAIEKIRNDIYAISSYCTKKELQAEIDYDNGKISAEKYREIMLGK